MKRLITIISVLLLLVSSMSIAFAEEAVDTVIDETEVVDDVADSEETIADTTTADTTTEAGVTPDSPLWGLKIAIERVNIVLTFDKAKKSEKRLRYAHKRLLEVNEMIKKGDHKNAARAHKLHADLVVDSSEDVDEIELDEGDSERVKEFRAKLKRNVVALEAVKTKLESKGVSAPGIEIALAIARAKAECRQELKEIVESGEADEEAIREVKSECREEIKEAVGEVKSRIREEIKERKGKRILERKEKLSEESELEEETEEEVELEEESETEEEQAEIPIGEPIVIEVPEEETA